MNITDYLNLKTACFLLCLVTINYHKVKPILTFLWQTVHSNGEFPEFGDSPAAGYTESGWVLCFGLGTAQCHGLFSFPHSWEWARSWEMHSWDRQLIPPGQRISHTYCAMVSSKSSGKRRKGITVVTRNHHACWGHAFQEVAKYLPANGKWWINPYYPLFSYTAFAFPIKLILARCTSLWAADDPAH